MVTDPAAPPLLIVTGLSGAGMSTALKDLEDLGYEVFDNLPLALVDPLLAEKTDSAQPLAVGIDSRTRGFSAADVLALVRRLGAKLIFITADGAELQKRFTETRRRHPLAKDRPVAAGIKQEQELLYPLREDADLLIDTTALSVHDLRRLVQGHFRLEGQKALSVTLMSFGYKYGLPREADIVMDIRFLKNPHWEETLRPLTGHDEAVSRYVMADPQAGNFGENFRRLVGPLLPLYAQEGKTYLTIALGCTGGRHRSVCVVENLKGWLAAQGVQTHIVHRDIDRQKPG